MDLENIENLKKSAKEFFVKNKYSEAIAFLELILVSEPENLEYAFMLKDSYDRNNQPAESLSVLKSLLKFYPNDEKITNNILSYFENIENKDIVKNINSFVKNFKGSRKDKQKILWAMSFSIYPSSKMHDFLLTKALQLRGAEIVPLICGKGQKGQCNVYGGVWAGYKQDQIEDNILSEKNCQTCVNSDKELWESFCEISPLELKNFITIQNNELDSFIELLPNDFMSWEYDGIKIGQWAIDVFRNNELLYNEKLVPNYFQKLKHYAKNIILVIDGIKNVLNYVKPDIIMSNDSYYYQWAVVEAIAKKQGIPFYNNWCGARKMGWAYNLNSPAMGLELSKTWEKFKENSLLDYQKNIVERFLVQRFDGNDMILNTAKKNILQTKINDELENLDKSKPTALLASNVIWDLAALNNHTIFNHMMEWIIETIKYFAEHTEYQLIIKAHPAEENENIPFTVEKIGDEIKKIFYNLPENIFFLPPKSNYNVYEILPKVEVGLVHTTTVGLEMVCRNIPVIAVARSPYYGKGFTIEPKSNQEYFNSIEELLSGNKQLYNNNSAELAKKFLFLYYFKYYLQLNILQHNFTNEPQILITSGLELLPGNNSVLDYVCNSILSHKEIISPESIPPDSDIRRGLYNFSEKDTLLGFENLVYHYRNQVKLQKIIKLGDYEKYQIEDFTFYVHSNLFKEGELKWIYNEIFTDDKYNPHSYTNNNMQINKGDIVFDIGACEGFFTFSAIKSGATKVYLFEPHPKMFAGLEFTFQNEIVENKVELLNYGVSDRLAEVGMNDGVEHISEAKISEEGTNKIKLINLDEFLKYPQIEQVDFVKMDIEGEEIKAILGAIKFINKFKPKLSIAVYHNYENAFIIKQILESSCPNYQIEFGGRYMWEIPHRPFMLYAYPNKINNNSQLIVEKQSNEAIKVSMNVKKDKVNILYATPVLEHPPASGPTLRVENSIKALSRESNLFIVSRQHFNMLGGETGENFYRNLVKEFVYAPSILNTEIINKDQADAEFFVEYSRKNKIDIIWFGFGCISYEIMKRVKILAPEIKIVSDTDSVWSRFILRELPFETSAERRLQIETEGRKKEMEEKEFTNFADVTTAVSPYDAEYYKNLTPDKNKIKIFSNVIDVENYQKNQPIPENFNNPSIYLAGTFYSPTSPMVRAAKWVIEDIFPLVKKEIPNCNFYIIGNKADVELSGINVPGVYVLGKVKSVLPYLCNVDVALVPLMFESGTRFKILEAGACGVPIVSTTLGAEGLPVTHEQDILIADESEAFAKAIIRIIINKNYGKGLAENCKNIVKASFSVESLQHEAKEIINYLLK